jgi:hypothetical protein
MTYPTLLNALGAGLIALILGTAHLLGPSDIEAAQAIADETHAAPIEVAQLQQAEMSAAPAAASRLPSR